MKYLFTFSLLILLTTFSFAQEISLKWESPTLIKTRGEHNKSLPSFQKKYFDIDLNENPRFHYTEQVNGNYRVNLTNVNYQTINNSNLGEIDKNKIPAQLEYTAEVVKGAGKYTLVVNLFPFVKEGKVIKRVNSFSIEKQATSTYLSRPSFQATAVLSSYNGEFHKISIDTTGIYKLDYDFFTKNNLATNFNPKRLKIYGNGGKMLSENLDDFRYSSLQENAIVFVGEEDDSFDPGDYILFYAQGPHVIDKKNGVSLANAQHSHHLYEEKAYYFINFNSPGLGERVSNATLTGTPSTTYTNFDQVLFYENDSINIYNVGRQWFGHNFAFENEKTFTFPLDGSIEGSIQVDYRFVGANAQNNSMTVSANGSQVGNMAYVGNEFEVRSGSGNTPSSTTPIAITVNLDNSANPSGNVYLDYLRVKFQQKLNFNNSQLGFRKLSNINDGNLYGFNIAGNPEYVWDVSDPTNATAMAQNGNTYLYQSTSTDFFNEFIAFRADQAFTPEYVDFVSEQNLGDLTGIDYVIVTHPDFLAQAQQLANYHANHSGVTTAVVTTTQVYNEFSSGSQDITAIRDFFTFLYNQSVPLKYALLFGDSSYDYKDRIANNTNFVPSYQSFNSLDLVNSFVTDDYFTMLDDSGAALNTARMDIAVGRLPAANTDEANILVNKTLAYIDGLGASSSQYGDWRTKIAFVVDDDDSFHTAVDTNSAPVIENNHPEYTLRKLYLDAFLEEGSAGGDRYPDVNLALENLIETGALLVNYFGHGGPNSWAQERVFTRVEIDALSNMNSEYTRLPVFTTVTCDFTVWDIPQNDSAGEALIKMEEGGAVAMITTSRAIAVSYGLGFNDILLNRLLEENGNQFIPIGEALRLAKVDYPSSDSGLSVNLMGDPLIPLNKPPRKVEIETINGAPANTFSGTLRALDFVTIEGSVLNPSGSSTDASFNGELTGSLFDKVVDKVTLNNDGNVDALPYTEQVDILFRGKTAVENGKFKLEFYVPKDINYDVGNGKLLLYAQNGETDAITYKNDILVGDINPDGIDDDEGPVVGLYMNNLNFANGGITDRDPYLLACVVDSTGINATGVGIGHDITELLDSDVNTTAVLNEYYEGGDTSPCINPNVLDYQKGRVLYRLRNLELGEHTVTFKVWDINNNSTTETLDFVVVDDGNVKLIMNRLLNWPNPFTNQTYFHFEHNCDSVLEAQIQIFTVSGKLVKTIRQTVTSEPFREGYRTDKFGIPWDGLDDFGNKIGKGVYIYRATIKGADSDICKGTATDVEKLVILK